MGDSKFSDPADYREASYRPDMAAEIDSAEDRFLELIAAQVVKLPANISRQAFNHCVAGAVLGAMEEAKRDGSLGELFEGGGTRSEMELATRLLAELIDSNNPALQAECIAFVMGLNISGGKSETAIARKHGVNKATVSKRCVRLKQVFGLDPSRGMKSEKAVESYRARQTGKRARPAPMKWSWSGLLMGVLQDVTPATAH
jgi:hypothetical protein